MKLTAFELKLALLEYYRFGKQCVAVDEFNGADVIADTGKEIIEIEVKVDKYDLLREKDKRKHQHYDVGQPYAACYPNKYLLCVPLGLADKAREVVDAVNSRYGIIGFDEQSFQNYVEKFDHTCYLKNFLVVLKRARKLHTNYSPRQTRLIAKRTSAKLITLMQKQHEQNVLDERMRLQ